jgi:hypothetical protein
VDNYNVGIGRTLKVLLAGGVALVAAAAAVIGTMTVTGHGRFNASSGSAGVAAATVIYHDSLTDRLMVNMAAQGARYVIAADEAYDINTVGEGQYLKRSGDSLIGAAGGGGGGLSGLTTNKITKATAADAIGDSRITDTGSGAVAVAAPSVSIQDSDASHTVTLTPGNESANRVLSVPVLGANAKVNVSTATQTANYLQKATADGVLANGAITDDGTTVTLTGTAATVLRASPAAVDTSTAGNAITVQASPAVAGTVTAGAAAGGNVYVTAGAAARKDSGNAAGGDIILTPGAGIGTGLAGTVQCWGGGGQYTTVIGKGATGLSNYSFAIGASTAAANDSAAIGSSSSASGMHSVAIGCSGSLISSSFAGVSRLANVCNIPYLNVIRKDNAEVFNSTVYTSTPYAGAFSVLFTNELDATQAALVNTSQNWTITVASNVVTVNTDSAHKFSVGQYFSTDADWTANSFMASLTDKRITAVYSTTFTFALTQANQGATTETNAGAGITPGDYVLPMPTGGSFFVEEVGIVCSTLNGTITTQPTCRFGTSADRDSLRAAEITTLLTALRTRERYTTLLTDVGETTLACGMTVPAVLNSATSYKIRFYFRGIFVEDE